MTDETRERILIALHRLLDENTAETQRRRSPMASLVNGARRNALQDAITIVKETR
jgi:hypothetical protein